MTPSSVASVTAGIVHPWTDEPAQDGFAIHAAAGASRPGDNAGSGLHASFRRAGRTQELALGLHVYSITPFDISALFVRFGFNLLEWDRVGDDDGAGVFGPSLEIGIGRERKAGPCLSASASRDFRFNDPDDTFLGVSVGWCQISPTRPIRWR